MVFLFSLCVLLMVTGLLLNHFLPSSKSHLSSGGRGEELPGDEDTAAEAVGGGGDRSQPANGGEAASEGRECRAQHQDLLRHYTG